MNYLQKFNKKSRGYWLPLQSISRMETVFTVRKKEISLTKDTLALSRVLHILEWPAVCRDISKIHSIITRAFHINIATGYKLSNKEYPFKKVVFIVL